MPGIEKFVAKFLKARKISMAELALRLGYKSPTSVARIAKGKANDRSVRKFANALENAFDMTAGEKSLLDDAVRVASLGRDGYLAEKEMWAFLRGLARTGDADVDMEIESVHDGTRQLLAERYAHASDIHITLLNSQYSLIFSQLRALLRRKDAQIEHYLTLDVDTADTIRTLHALMPIFFEKRYNCFATSGAQTKENALRGVSGADVMVCAYADAGGARREDMIVFDARGHGRVATLSGGGAYARMLGIRRERYRALKRTYFEYTALENYVQYSIDYMKLELNRAVYKIKPDIGIDYVPEDILEAAVREGPIPMDEALLHTIAALRPIYEKRTRDAFTKRQPTHTILKKEAMRRFAISGKLSDHFWGMRPFTPGERARILAGLLKQQTENPYFHLYFLRDDDTLMDAEIACYEGVGVLILDANTDYNLAENHAEAMITHTEFARLFKAFMLNTLIKREVISGEETRALLTRLIALCAEADE